MKNEALSGIIARLRNHDDGILALTWVGNNYSKLDLIKDLEKVLAAPAEISYDDAVEAVDIHVSRIRKEVAKRVKDMFPEFPSEVTSSMDDLNWLIARVFNVPDERHDEIHEKIEKLNHELFPDSIFMLTASLKTVEATEKYYPEFAKSEGV